MRKQIHIYIETPEDLDIPIDIYATYHIPHKIFKFIFDKFPNETNKEIDKLFSSTKQTVGVSAKILELSMLKPV